MIDFLAVLRAQVEQNLRDRQAGRERQDAGVRVSGSRKEIAALRKLSLNPGELMKAEASPEAAAAMVRKNQVFPRPAFEAWQTAGKLTPQAAGFLFLVWKTFPDKPKTDNPFARMTYVRLAADLHRWVSAQAASPLPGADHHLLHAALLNTIFGWHTNDVAEVGKKVQSMRYNEYDSYALRDHEKERLWRLLAGARRYVPADDMVRWTGRFTNKAGAWSNTDQDQTELTRLLYDFPELDVPAGEEAHPEELFLFQLKDQELRRSFTYWRDAAEAILKSPTCLSWLSYKPQAHQRERSLIDYDQVSPFTVYLPRVLDLYYGAAFASLFFPTHLYKLPTKSTRFLSPGNEGRLKGWDELAPWTEMRDWDKVAKLVGAVTADKAPKPEGSAAAPKPGQVAENMPLSHIRRKGGMLVTDVQVHEDFLLHTFGFRAVEYGNYVRDKEGTEHLRHFVSALTDLCDVLNLNPAKINEAGGLAIAFGSRGHGGKAMATYHPSQRIINLTKSRGDGCVAHEWLHYLDHLLLIHLGYASQPRDPFASLLIAGLSDTDMPNLETNASGRVSLEVNKRPSASQKAAANREKSVVKSNVEAARREITWAGWPVAGQNALALGLLRRVWQSIRHGYYLDGQKLVASHPEAEITTLYVQYSTRSMIGTRVPALREFGSFPMGKSGGLGKNLGDYVAKVRTGRMTQAELWETMRRGNIGYGSYFTLGPKETPATCAGSWVFEKVAFELGETISNVPFYRPLVSEFYQFSGRQPNSAYWAAPYELFARSFERFVHDELASKGQANNYLVDGDKFSRNSPFYPAGAEATLINDAWRAFFQFLSQDAALGPFVAPWANGERVDEYLALDGSAKKGAEVTSGVIVPASPPLQPPKPPELNRRLALARARVRVAAAALELEAA